MPRFLVLLSPRAGTHESAAELGARAARFIEWVARGRDSGLIRGGARLGPSAAVITCGEIAAAPAPDRRGYDRIAGYLVIDAQSFACAVAIARDCPAVDPGTVRVLEVDGEASF
jgi:hypothetical protein